MKPVVLAAVMFGSAFYITGSGTTAAILAALPLVLGWIGVMTGPAFGLTGLAFIAAIGWAVMPDDLRAAVAGQAEHAAAATKATAGDGQTAASPDRPAPSAESPKP